jgi:hypothetical protein
MPRSQVKKGAAAKPRPRSKPKVLPKGKGRKRPSARVATTRQAGLAPEASYRAKVLASNNERGMVEVNHNGVPYQFERGREYAMSGAVIALLQDSSYAVEVIGE